MPKVTFEIPADDLTRAVKFYEDVFGWSSLKLPFEHALVDASGKPVNPATSDGGITKRRDKVQSPVLIITVDSIEEAAEKVKRSGGQIIVEKTKVGEFGHSSYIKDTEGNVICMWGEIK